MPEAISRTRSLLSALTNVGDRVGEFDILDTLGEGAFGRVFLARQTSLDRVVALKVTANLGQEGRTMARLEHASIVQVFSETLEVDRQIRLLCMQYVPGANLQTIIQQLRHLPPADRDGRAILAVVDNAAQHSTYFDPASLRYRETLSGCRLDEAVCWIGQQLAEALAYAHARGVLHRDIKPANVIVNQYGRPMLSDFSLSFPTTGQVGIEAAVFGGTLGYMAPEHVNALDPDHPAGPDQVTESSDIYSLGVVLFDLLTCAQRPAQPASTKGTLQSHSQHRAWMESVLLEQHCPLPLARILLRCLDPSKTGRFPSARHLAEALAGCQTLLRARRELPRPSTLAGWAEKYPLRFILGTTVIPNISASAANITYNSLFVIRELPLPQQAAFAKMVFWYNVVVVTVMLVMLYHTLFAAARDWFRMRRHPLGDDTDVDDARRRTLSLPKWVIILGMTGWLPFAVIIPGGMELLAGPIDRGALLHLSLTFLVTGLIALVANYYVTTFVVVRGMYTQLWADTSGFTEAAAGELSHVQRLNLIGQIAAGLTPLGAATLLVIVGPEQFTPDSFHRFRSVLVVLIGMGIAGFWLAMTASATLNESVALLTAAGRPMRAHQTLPR